MAFQSELDDDKLFSVFHVRQHEIKNKYLQANGLPKSVNNCFPCVLKFFEIINEEQYVYLSSRPNFGLHTQPEIEHVYNLVDPEGNYKFVKVNKDNTTFSLNIVFEKLNRSHGTLIGVKTEDGKIGHCMLFAKDNSGQQYLIDPQSEQYYVGYDAIMSFISQHQITKLFCLFDLNEVSRNLEMITDEISNLALGKNKQKKFNNIFYFKKQKSLKNKKKKKKKSLKKKL